MPSQSSAIIRLSLSLAVPSQSFLSFWASALVRKSSAMLKSLYLNGLSWQQTLTQ